MKLEVLNMFLVADCKQCKMRHAPIRDCNDSEGNRMYFDIVVSFYGTVLFNGTPEETKKFIQREISSLQPDTYVMQGSSTRTFSLNQYMDL